MHAISPRGRRLNTRLARRARRSKSAGASDLFSPMSPPALSSGTRGIHHTTQYIRNQFVPSVATGLIPVENPSTNEILGHISEGSPSDAKAAIAAAHDAFAAWSLVPNATRGDVLKGLGAVVRANVKPLAELLAKEQSKVAPLAEIEIAVTAEYFDYHAGLCRSIEGEIIPSDTPGETIYMHKLPIGVAVGIAPWNFPVFVMARKICPALTAGCTVVVKTSEVTPLTCFALAKLWKEAIDSGADPRLKPLAANPGVINIISGLGNTIGAPLCADERVGIISMTGSLATGKAIMKSAAENMTKVSLELGGKAPAIVFADADLELAAEKIKDSRLTFSGQVCNCAERVYVHESVAHEFTQLLVQKMNDSKVGEHPNVEGATYCSLINKDHTEKVEGMLNRAVQGGAKVLCGGGRMPGPGYRFSPTVLTGVRQTDEIIQDEVFGPILPVMTFSTFDEVLELANDCKFGLTSSIFTRDVDVIERCRTELRFGETYVNRHNFEAIQGFHAGFRNSGIGGADGKHGLAEYLSTHAVYVQRTREGAPTRAGAGVNMPTPKRRRY